MKLTNLIKNAQSKDIFDIYPDAVIVMDFNKKILSWNEKAQEVFGYSQKEVKSKSLAYILEDNVDSVFAIANKNETVVIKAVSKFGDELFVEISASEILEKEQVILTARNVTKTHKMIKRIINDYEKTKETSKNRNGFLAGLSSELKTPMHSIIGFSQALLDGLSGELNDKQEKYLTIINRNANSLLSLLNSILDIAKIEAGIMEFNFKNFDVVNVINLVAQTFEKEAQSKKLKFEVELSDLIKRTVYSDENTLRQVIINILENSIKFTNDGYVKLKVSHPDLEYVSYQGLIPRPDYTDKSYLLISISDTGIGIPEDELDNIFDEYSPVANPKAKKISGSGLGLAITRKLLEELGGVIWVESEVNKGSTFNIIVPVERNKN